MSHLIGKDYRKKEEIEHKKEGLFAWKTRKNFHLWPLRTELGSLEAKSLMTTLFVTSAVLPFFR